MIGTTESGQRQLWGDRDLCIHQKSRAMGWSAFPDRLMFLRKRHFHVPSVTIVVLVSALKFPCPRTFLRRKDASMVTFVQEAPFHQKAQDPVPTATFVPLSWMHCCVLRDIIVLVWATEHLLSVIRVRLIPLKDRRTAQCVLRAIFAPVGEYYCLSLALLALCAWPLAYHTLLCCVLKVIIALREPSPWIRLLLPHLSLTVAAEASFVLVELPPTRKR